MFDVPHLYFVSKAATHKLSPQPSVPFNVTQARDLAKHQVSGAYSETNFGVTWTLVVAYNDRQARETGLVNLAP